jgi:signal transduction histidine kinase
MARPALRFYLPLAAGALLILLVWIAVAVTAREARRVAEREAAATRENVANSLAEYQTSSVRAIDMTLVFLREVWREDRAQFDAAVRRHEELLAKERVVQVAVVDAEGWLQYSRLPSAPRINFADRGYFMEAKGSSVDVLRVSEPVMGRVTRQWAIQFSRAVRAPDGTFEGLVVVAVTPPALQEVYKEIDLGADGVIVLARADGHVLTRSRGFEPGQSIAAILPPGAAQGRGAFRATSVLDGIERTYSYRGIPDYGLLIVVGQGEEAIFGAYRQQRAYLYGFTAAVTILAACSAVLLWLRRRDQARFEAERERLMLELHDGCIQSIYAVGLNLQGSRGSLPAGSTADAAIARAEADLNLVINDLRAFIGGEKPGARTPEQFRELIERSLPRNDRTRFEVALDETAVESLAPEQAEHVLRIVREAAANVARHAQASEARIGLRRDEGSFVLEVVDDGRGIEPQRAGGGLGLAHIHARATKLKGRAEIGRGSVNGTRLTIRFPARA